LININEYQHISTNGNNDQQLSIPASKKQQLSTLINKCQHISTNMPNHNKSINANNYQQKPYAEHMKNTRTIRRQRNHIVSMKSDGNPMKTTLKTNRNAETHKTSNSATPKQSYF